MRALLTTTLLGLAASGLWMVGCSSSTSDETQSSSEATQPAEQSETPPPSPQDANEVAAPKSADAAETVAKVNPPEIRYYVISDA